MVRAMVGGTWWRRGLLAASLAAMAVAPMGVAGAAAAMAAIGLAAFASGIAGFAFSAICGAMLFHLEPDPIAVVQIMITCSIANQAAMNWAGRHSIDWRALGVYLTGAMFGLPVGVWVLLHADRAVYLRALGGFLLLYGLFMLLRRPMTLARRSAWLDVAVGMLGGITAGAAGFPGAFITIWCGMKGWDKARQRAVFQPFILVLHLASLLAISLARPHAGASSYDPAFLLFLPASLLGTAFGMALYQKLSDAAFARAVNLLLMASGLSFVF